jgi:hypothetical protein
MENEDFESLVAGPKKRIVMNKYTAVIEKDEDCYIAFCGISVSGPGNRTPSFYLLEINH